MRSSGISMPSALQQGYKKGYLSGHEPDKAIEQQAISFRHHDPSVPTGESRSSNMDGQQAQEQSQSTSRGDSKDKQRFVVWVPMLRPLTKNRWSFHSTVSSLKSKAKRLSSSPSSTWLKDGTRAPESEERQG